MHTTAYSGVEKTHLAGIAGASLAIFAGRAFAAAPTAAWDVVL